MRKHKVAGSEYDPKLYNKDLKPVEKQTWNSYNIAALWMSVIHSVGGYLTAGSLFSLRLASWQVFIVLIVGILIIQFLCNLSSKPSQIHKIPFPVVSRSIFGVHGANIPAIIRMSICVAYFGVQTFLGSKALTLVLLKFWPSLSELNNMQTHAFLGLSMLGWLSFALMWTVQMVLFQTGLAMIRWLIDLAGPAVYVVMLALAIYLVAIAGWAHLNFQLNDGGPLDFEESLFVMVSAMALVVSSMGSAIFSFSDFSRFAKSWSVVKMGNFLGLPINYLFFAILTVVTISATKPVFGKMLTDPIEMIAHIDTPIAVIIGASIGINIANFICPAFDLSNLAPKYISWHSGGLIAALVSVLLTPWNWYDKPEANIYTLGIIGALMGPLYGIFIAGYYIIGKQKVWVPELYSTRRNGRYWFWHGFNPNAILALAISGAFAIFSAVLPKLLTGPHRNVEWIADFSWFIGSALGFGTFTLLERVSPQIKLHERPAHDKPNFAINDKIQLNKFFKK